MKQLLVSEFGFEKKSFIFNLSSNSKISEKRLQTDLLSLSYKFKCPVSKEIFENKLIHKSECKYKYCKGGWDFSYRI